MDPAFWLPGGHTRQPGGYQTASLTDPLSEFMNSPKRLNRVGALQGTTHPFGPMSLISPNECG
jgi:hypothetical protein